MADYNRVMLIGNLTRDPELRYLPSNTAVCSVGLAVNDRWRDKQSGEMQERANFIDCEAFGRSAEVINQYMKKGRPLFIEGKLRLDQWQDKDGNNRSKLKVVIDSFQFLGGRDDAGGGGSSGGGGGGYSQGGGQPRQSSGGGGGNQGGGAPQGGGSGGDSGGGASGPAHQPIEEDDIPF